MSQVEGQNDNAGTILRLTDTLLNPSFQTRLCEDEYITENQKILTTTVFHLFSLNHYNILKWPSRYKKIPKIDTLDELGDEITSILNIH